MSDNRLKIEDKLDNVVDELKVVAKNIAEQSSSFYYNVRVEIETGSVCTATMGTVVKQAASVDGLCDLYLTQTGVWTITGETPEGNRMIAELINVTDHGVKYIVARFKGIYGVKWDGTASTALTRTDDSVALVSDEGEPVSYVGGMESGYGSPFDTIAPWSDIHTVEDDVCGTLVAIPKFWYKMDIADDNSLTLQIAEYAADGFNVSPAHMDRGDGHGERDIIYVGKYHCGTGYKSTSGVKPLTNLTRAAFRSGIHALGDDVWQNDFATRVTLWMLYLVEYANFNTQATIGYGCGNGSGTEAMGYTDAMPYHTGTMLTSKSTYGVGTQYRYIEGLWDNTLDWCDGIYFSNADVYGILNPANFSDTANGTLIFTRPATSGWISAWQKGSDDFDWFLYPSAEAGGEHSYVGDFCNYASGGVVLRCGGYYNHYQYHGFFFLNGNYGASSADGGIGSRLLKLPN